MSFLNELSATTLVSVFHAVSVLVGAQEASKLITPVLTIDIKF